MVSKATMYFNYLFIRDTGPKSHNTLSTRGQSQYIYIKNDKSRISQDVQQTALLRCATNMYSK